MRRAEAADSVDNRLGDEYVSVQGAQLQLLIAIDDRAGFEQDRRHAGVSQHHELVVAVDAGRRVHQLAPPVPYTRERFNDNYQWTLGWGLVAPGATYEKVVDNRAWQ